MGPVNRVGRWPLYRQLTGTDRRGPGAAARAAGTAAGRGPPTADEVVKSVCPYCAVGCGQNVYVAGRGEVDPDRGRPGLPGQPRAAVPEGLGQPAADHRAARASTGCSTAARTGPTGKTLDLDTAMDMIADRVIAARRDGWQQERRRQAGPAHAGVRQPGRRDARQRRELPDQEAVHRAGRDPDREPGPDMTLLHRPRSGDLVRPRRRHHLPAGPAELRLHRDRGLEHGRVPPGRLPVGDGGQGARRDGHPRRPAVHPDQRAGRPARARSGPGPTSRSSAGSSTTSSTQRARTSASTCVDYTNAADHLSEDFPDTEDLDGLFSGLDREHRHATTPTAGSTRGRRAARPASATGRRQAGTRAGDGPQRGPAARRTVRRRGAHRLRTGRDAAASALRVPGAEAALRPLHAGDGGAGLRHPAGRTSCRSRDAGHRELRPRADHGVRATRSAGPSTPSACSTSAPPRSCSCCSATSAGPGGGILALRGHAIIQGSTDIPTLFDLLPGYLPMPHAHGTRTSTRYIARRRHGQRASGRNMRAYMVSLLKAWWGEAATAENDFCFDYLPRLTGRPLHLRDRAGAARRRTCKGYFLVGENPAVGSANGRLQRLGLANLDWLVVRDFSLIESATFWKDGPEIETGELRTEDIGTEVFFLPAAAHTEKDGTFTNTQRMLQWHHKAVEPAGRRAQRPVVHLPPGPRASGRSWPARPTSRGPAAPRPDLGLPDRRAASASPTPRRCWPRSTAATPTAQPLSSYDAAARTTARPPCGCWIYCGRLRRRGQPGRPAQARHASRTGSRPSGAGRGRRTGGSSTTAPRPTREGKPWSERKALRLVGRREQASGPATTSPDFDADQAAGLPAAAGGATGVDATAGTDPFIMQADGKAWLFAPGRPGRRPAADALRAAGVAGAATRSTASSATRSAQVFAQPDNRYQPERRRAGLGRVPVRAHHLPADRAPHRGRHEPLAALPVGAAAGVVLRGLPGAGRRARASSTAAGPRSSPRGPRSRPGCWSPTRMRAADGRRAGACTRSGCPTTGAPNGHRHRRLGQRPARARPGPERAHPGGQGARPATSGPAAARAGRRCASWSRSTSSGPGITDETGTEVVSDRASRRPRPAGRARDGYAGHPPRMGFFTDTSVCIGCKACEVACKEWNGARRRADA